MSETSKPTLQTTPDYQAYVVNGAEGSIEGTTTAQPPACKVRKGDLQDLRPQVSVAVQIRVLSGACTRPESNLIGNERSGAAILAMRRLGCRTSRA